jgi:hypothetical protein
MSIYEITKHLRDYLVSSAIDKVLSHFYFQLTMKELKCRGFSDAAIARLTKTDEIAVRRRRAHELCVTPFVKQIDTLAAEFPAKTNYLYMTYNASEHDTISDPGTCRYFPLIFFCLIISQNHHYFHLFFFSLPSLGVIVLGNGAYCIGSSVEFDWCAVSCVRTLRRYHHKAIVINCNPETVSTDYDESNQLFFEELTFERVLDIYEKEKALGVVVSVGGQVSASFFPRHCFLFFQFEFSYLVLLHDTFDVSLPRLPTISLSLFRAKGFVFSERLRTRLTLQKIGTSILAI